jgi:hypothetical protein
MVTICTNFFNILKLCNLPTECICVFHMVLTINIDCFTELHQRVNLRGGDAVCFL